MWIKLRNIVPDGSRQVAFTTDVYVRTLVVMTRNEPKWGRPFGYAQVGKQGARLKCTFQKSDVEPMAWVEWAVMEIYEKGLVHYSAEEGKSKECDRKAQCGIRCHGNNDINDFIIINILPTYTLPIYNAILWTKNMIRVGLDQVTHARGW